MSGKTFVQVEIPETEDYQRQNGIAMFTANGTATTVESGSTTTTHFIEIVWTQNGFTNTGWSLNASNYGFSLSLESGEVTSDLVSSEFEQALSHVTNNKGACIDSLVEAYPGCVNWAV